MPTTFAKIMEKLKATDWYPTFVRHVDGNTLNNYPTNLELVTLKDAFKHISDWTVDWVCFVTEEERAFLVNMLTSK